MANNYTVVGTVASTILAGIQNYSFVDPKIKSLGAAVVYYRLQQKDKNGRYTHCQIVALSINNNNIILFYPNPVRDMVNVTITINQPEQVKARVIDAAGKIISKKLWELAAGSTSLSVDVRTLTKGFYYLELKGTTINENKQFSKQ